MSTSRAESSSWAKVAAHSRVDRVLVVCLRPEDLRGLEIVEGPITMVYSSPNPIEQQDAPFRAVRLAGCLTEAAPELQRAALHLAAVHLDRGGVLVVDASLHPALADACVDLGLLRDPDAVPGEVPGEVVTYRRNDRTNIMICCGRPGRSSHELHRPNSPSNCPVATRHS